MADCSKVNVENQKTVQTIHEKLKKEISEIAKAKAWSAEKTQAFEESLNELYNDVIHESIKSNVTVKGKDWVDEPTETITKTKTVQEPVNKERLKEVNDMWTSLEDLLRDTTSKRKNYPPKIAGSISNVLDNKTQILEKYSPVMKSESWQHREEENNQDDCAQRLEDAMKEQTHLTKTLPVLQNKVENLQQAIATHKNMEGSETDAVLFAKNKSSTPLPSRRSSRLQRTPNRFSPITTKQSEKKTRNTLLAKNLSYSYKKK